MSEPKAEIKAELKNIYAKLQKSRVELQKKEMKKSGENKFSHYDYFELGDFLPQINEICERNGLATIFEFTEEKAYLSIINVENTEENLTFSTPIKIPELKGCNFMQSIGGTQTYARRYLYIMAFEIAENDTIDSAEVDQDAIDRKKKINKPSVMTINKLIAESETDIKKFLGWAEVEKVEDITNEMLGTCLKMLEKKITDNKNKPVKVNQVEDLEF